MPPSGLSLRCATRGWLPTLLLAVPALLAAQPARDAGPPGLHWEGVAFDADRRRLVVVGGVTAAGDYLADTWAWDGVRWSTVADAASGPAPRHAHAMAYDAARRRVVLFGGAYEPRAPAGAAPPPAVTRCDTWALAGATWTRLADGPCVTDRTGAASLVYDARARALLLVDGPVSTSPADTTMRPLRLFRLRDDRWTVVDTTGPRRSRTSAGGVAYDAARSALVVPVLDGPDAGVWEWRGGRWHHVVAAGAAPPPRRHYATAYDPGTRRVVLLGGLAPAPRRPLADGWAWDGRRWTPLPADGPSADGPSARSHAALLSDGRRLLYVGGSGAQGLLRELWTLERGAWRRASPGAP